MNGVLKLDNINLEGKCNYNNNDYIFEDADKNLIVGVIKGLNQNIPGQCLLESIKTGLTIEVEHEQNTVKFKNNTSDNHIPLSSSEDSANIINKL